MFIVLVLILFVSIYLFVKKQYSHWENEGIPSIKPMIPFGNLQSVVKKQRSFGTAIYDLYLQTKEPFVGIYLFFKPAILVNDAEFVKNILTRDFQHFHDRGVYCEPERDPMSANIFSLRGMSWKTLRAKLTPAFTSGKIKGMFPTVKKVGEEFVELLIPLAEKEAEIDIRDLASRYVIDSLASTAFGQDEISSLKEPDHEFRMIGKTISNVTKLKEVIRVTAAFLCPSLLNIFRMKGLSDEISSFFMRLVTKTIKEREKNHIVRKDIMQYLIQLRNNNDIKTIGEEWKISDSKAAKSMSYEEIASQAFIFYIAGSETTSATIAYTLYELTKDEELLKRAQDDVTETLEKHQGELSYEAIMDMKFLDLCVKETLRKYPALPILNRECTKDYPIPGSTYTIKKGTSIIISLLGIHRDEQYFPNPLKYDPDRFTDEKRAFDENMYMPFGIGQHNCIAYRMGLIVSNLALAMLLFNFDFKALSKKELEFDFGTVVLIPLPGQCKIKIAKKAKAV